MCPIKCPRCDSRQALWLLLARRFANPLHGVRRLPAALGAGSIRWISQSPPHILLSSPESTRALGSLRLQFSTQLASSWDDANSRMLLGRQIGQSLVALDGHCSSLVSDTPRRAQAIGKIETTVGFHLVELQENRESWVLELLLSEFKSTVLATTIPTASGACDESLENDNYAEPWLSQSWLKLRSIRGLVTLFASTVIRTMTQSTSSLLEVNIPKLVPIRCVSGNNL